MQRLFLDDVYALYDGVRLGLGRAVLPLHPVGSEVVVEERYKTLALLIYLSWVNVPYQSALEKAVLDSIISLANQTI